MSYRDIGKVFIERSRSNGLHRLRFQWETASTGDATGEAVRKMRQPIDGTLMRVVYVDTASGESGTYGVELLDRYGCDMLMGLLAGISPGTTGQKPINADVGAYTWPVVVGGPHTFRVTRAGAPVAIAGTFDLYYRVEIARVGPEFIEA